MKLRKYIYNSIDERSKCIEIFLDLTKVLDAVNHQILTYKIDKLGIRETLNLIELFNEQIPQDKYW